MTHGESWNDGPKTIPTAVLSTTNCQATKMKYDNATLATGRSVKRGTHQWKPPRNALAKKPYAIAFVWTMRQRPGDSHSTDGSGFQWTSCAAMSKPAIIEVPI